MLCHRLINMISHSKKIVDYIEKEKIVTSQDVSKLLKISWNTADSWLKELLIEGKIVRMKRGGVNLWMIK